MRFSTVDTFSDLPQLFEGRLWDGALVYVIDTSTFYRWDKPNAQWVVQSGTGGGDYWVDPQSGSDTNPGTQSEPFATLDHARDVIGPLVLRDTTIHMLPDSASEGHTTTRLWDPVFLAANLKIVGEENIDQTGDLTLTSYSARVYDFSGIAPGWTPDQFVGMTLISISGGIVIGQSRTIVANTIDTITVSNRHVAPSFASNPVAGDEFRVVTPAVAIRTSISGNFDPSLKLYGGPDYASTIQWTERLNRLQMENLEMRVPDGETYSEGNLTIELYGLVEINGVHWTKDSSAQLTVDVRGVLFSGEYEGPDDDVLAMGWCMVGKDRGGNTPLPDLAMHDSIMYGAWVGGPVMLQGGSFLRWHANAWRVNGAGFSGFPHGSFYAGPGSEIVLSGTASGTTYVTNFDGGEWDFEANRGFIQVGVAVNHLGTGQYARARHHGQINILENPIAVGSGLEIKAEFGSQIRISGADGSTLGDARAGFITPTTRAAAAWPAGTIVDGSESSHIYRSS